MKFFQNRIEIMKISYFNFIAETLKFQVEKLIFEDEIITGES